MTPAPHTFDCGCRLDPVVIDGVNTLQLHACSATCRIVRLLLEEADERGKPAEVREVPT